MERIRLLFFCLTAPLFFVLVSLPVFAQKIQIYETHIDSLLKIQATQGSDSLFNTIGRLPIWLIDQEIAIEIANNLVITPNQYGIERRYLYEISKHVESDKILEKLNKVLDSDLEQISDSLSYNGSVLQIRKDLSIAYFFQNQEKVLQSLSMRIEKLEELLEKAKNIKRNERRDIITRFV